MRHSRPRAAAKAARRLLVILSVLGLVAIAGARADSPPEPPPFDPAPWQALAQKDAEIGRLHAELRKARRSARINGRLARSYARAARRRWQPTVDHAIRLAALTFGVSRYELRAVGSCESHLNPFARNGQYRGVFQEGPMFERGPFRELGVWDPYANVFTAAFTVSREGWRQWECRP